jgi:NitT/TauT family transport system substrate-binding protein
MLKGAKWVNTNPRLAARLSVEKKYLASNPELNTTAIGNLNYMPSVLGGKAAVLSAAHEMKRTGMLSANTDVDELAKKAFVHLEGVNDGWVEGLQIAQLPGGRVPEDQAMRLAAELATRGTPEQVATCCAPASRVAPQPGPALKCMVAIAQ